MQNWSENSVKIGCVQNTVEKDCKRSVRLNYYIKLVPAVKWDKKLVVGTGLSENTPN